MAHEDFVRLAPALVLGTGAVQAVRSVAGKVRILPAGIALLAITQHGQDRARMLLLQLGIVCRELLLDLGDRSIRRIFALCNANRHVGLALILTANFLHLQKSIPAVACYALIAPVVMIVYAKLFPAVKAAPASVEAIQDSFR